MEYRFDCQGGYINYILRDDGAYISGFGMKPTEVVIPDFLMDKPVKAVLKKAFLGAKILKSVSLPASVSDIADYAFASCDNLESIFLPNEEVTFQNSCFSKDLKLKEIALSDNDDISHLMAAAATIMEADYLLKEREHFFDKWDAKLKSILSESDEEGFVFMVLCGEEDLTADVVEYREVRRKRKAFLAFLRLIYDKELTADFREILNDYLINHSCGCESDAAFRVILEHCEEKEYTDLFFALPMISDDNFEKIISILADRYGPFKAKVLSWMEDRRNTISDFFDEFEL